MLMSNVIAANNPRDGMESSKNDKFSRTVTFRLSYNTCLVRVPTHSKHQNWNCFYDGIHNLAERYH